MFLLVNLANLFLLASTVYQCFFVIYVLFYQSASLAKTSLINLMSLVYQQDFGLEDIL